ncbi:MAG: sulfurtransferase-like selenium metabolism protein YedF [Firmicutes bacterium]|nr:sulfurtransferase-like selenium metabolism protein YedF [Bacillota bacterium]
MKKTVDARGMNCPLPVIEAKKALQETQGQLEVIVDNTIALQNLEKMAKQMGLEYKLETRSEAEHAITITVGFAETKSQVKQNQTVVVISSDQMGSGDPDLGRVLMKSFIYALTELEELPTKVLLYNGGVKLAIQGSDSLGDLQKLAQRGVEILSCGTCLSFYQLTEKLGVGSITNMYEIVQSQMEATNIIRP